MAVYEEIYFFVGDTICLGQAEARRREEQLSDEDSARP